MILLYILLCLVSVVLIALVLMQDSKSGLGGLTGGTTMSSFGANTDKVLIKFTGGAGAVFFLLVIGIHLGNKSGPGQKSIMPAATTVEKKSSTPTVVVPTHDVGGADKKAVDSKKDKEPEKVPSEGAGPTGTSVTIPLKDAKEAPASETKLESKEKAVTPTEPEKK